MFHSLRQDRYVFIVYSLKNRESFLFSVVRKIIIYKNKIGKHDCHEMFSYIYQTRCYTNNVVGDTPIPKPLRLGRVDFDGLYLPIKMCWIFFFFFNCIICSEF